MQLRHLAVCAIGDLPGCKHTAQKLLAMLVLHSSNPLALDDVGPYPKHPSSGLRSLFFLH